MDNPINSDLIRGHINTIILTALFEGDKYGYEICKDIEIKSHGKYILKQPTLYSALKRLEDQGYVEAYWGAVSNGGRRRYYALTELGKSISKQNQIEWEYSRSIIDNLISKNDFDFENNSDSPSLDFGILKKSTTRLNTGKSSISLDDEKDDEFDELLEKDLFENKNFEKDSVILTSENKIDEIAQTKHVNNNTDNVHSVKDEHSYEKEETSYERDYKLILKKLLPKKKPVISQIVLDNTEVVNNEKVTKNIIDEDSYEIPKQDDNLLPHRQKSNDFSDIYEKAQMEGLKINKFESKKNTQERKVYFLLKNKLSLNVIFFLYFIMIAETALIFALLNKILLWGLNNYLAILSLVTIIPILAFIIYLTDPKKKSNADYSFKNQFGNFIIIFFVLILLILGSTLLFSVPLIVEKEFYSKVVVPIIFASNVLFYPIIYSIYIKSNKYFI